MKKNIFTYIILFIFTLGCSQSGTKLQDKKDQTNAMKNEPKAEMPLNTVNPPKTTGNIERFSPKLESILSEKSKLEIIAEGFVWSEGPLWLPNQKKVIFSDVPRNRIYQWSPEEGLSLYLDSAGYTGSPTESSEPGSNGLLLDSKDNLTLCQHGNRQMARMDAPLDKPESKFTTLTNNYKGKKLNSPNDAVFSSIGDLYFTDPPYGLPNQGEGSSKELGFQGVYKLSTSGELSMIDDQLKRPNGIALSPDEKTLYVSNSDPENPVWMAYTLNAEGMPISKRIFFDAKENLGKWPNLGLPDGLKVDRKGNIFATGPGGVYIFSSSAELMGIINTGHANGNCALDTEENILYITADMYLMRIALK